MDIKEKIENEALDAKSREGKHTAFSRPMINAMVEFCEQEPELAQAVEQSDKNFGACLDYVARQAEKGVLSDLKAYKEMVKFYFPTADITMKMTVNLSGDNGYEPPPIEVKTNSKDNFELSLESLLDF